MFASAGRALSMLFDRRFLGLFAATLALTLALFVALFLGVEYLLWHLPPLGSIWVNRFLELAAPSSCSSRCSRSARRLRPSWARSSRTASRRVWTSSSTRPIHRRGAWARAP